MKLRACPSSDMPALVPGLLWLEFTQSGLNDMIQIEAAGKSWYQCGLLVRQCVGGLVFEMRLPKRSEKCLVSRPDKCVFPVFYFLSRSSVVEEPQPAPTFVVCGLVTVLSTDSARSNFGTTLCFAFWL